MEFNNYENKSLTKEYVNKTLIPFVLENLIDGYDIQDSDEARDMVFEIIDGLEEVIYNYQAKKICEAFDMDPFDYSEITGERYENYNVMAFELIERKFFEAYDLEEIFDKE